MPAELVQPPKSAKAIKTKSKPVPAKPNFPKDADLRHCLDLETDAAIAKCAGE